MNENMAKLEELIKDKRKVAEIFGGTPEEARINLSAIGIDLEDDEFKAIMIGAKGDDEGSLSEEELIEVTGGCKGCYDFFRKVGQCISKLLDQICGQRQQKGNGNE